MLQLMNGVRVLDFTRLIPGAHTTMFLADYGADVIKVERPPAGDYLRTIPPLLRNGVGYYHLMMNRNKRSLAVDDRTPEGRAALERLIKTADVIVEGSRPGVMAGEGFGYESARSIQPKVIYCSLTGFGQTGPFAGLPSHGLNIDSLAGVLKIDRSGSTPQISDDFLAIGAVWGSAFAAMAIAFAQVQVLKTGRGCYLDASCWDGAIQMDFRHVLSYANQGVNWPSYSTYGSKYDVYRTKDGQELMLCPIENKFWENFCNAVNRPDLKDMIDEGKDFDYGHSSLSDTLQGIVGSKTIEEWTTLIRLHDIPATPVIDRQQRMHDQHFLARERLIAHEHPEAGDVKLVTAPVKVSGANFEIERPAPSLGEHNQELLSELGYSAQEIAEMRSAGILQP